jgi:hypothetical protein
VLARSLQTMSHTTVIHSLAPIAPEHLNVVAQDLDTAEKRKRFEESATELMKDPMFRASAAEEIKHLRQTIRELKATFAIVRGDLWNFDSQSFVDEKGRPLRLLDEWVKYEQVGACSQRCMMGAHHRRRSL